MQPLHPLHAMLLGGTLPAFVGVLLSDVAYFRTFEIQWKNFAAWLIVGGLVFAGLALLWALIALLRNRTPRRTALIVHAVLMLATFALGLVNAFVHAGDAWASMPTGLVLSVIVAVSAAVAAWLGFAWPDSRSAR